MDGGCNVTMIGIWSNPLEGRGISQDVTGAPYREVNSKVATAPNTQSKR